MLQDEKILTFAQAARSLPALNGKTPAPSTIWRWSRKGISGVRLETLRLGGRFVTSCEAIERFAARLAEIPPQARAQRESPPQDKPRTQKQRQKAMERADAILRERGM